jgi:FkbM family methyltransferase
MQHFDNGGELRGEIDRWLDAHVAPLAGTESRGFTEWRSEVAGPLFIYGAGGLGRKLASGLRAEGVAIAGFCDSNPATWGRHMLDLPVMSPLAAAAAAGDSGGFIISTWSLGAESRNAEIKRTLDQLGVKHSTFFTTPFWEYPRQFLPHYRIDLPSKLLAARGDILEAAGLLADAESRRQFFVQLKLLATTTFDEVSYDTPGDTYFPAGIVSPLMIRRFVDCGAYDGDTLKSLCAHAGELLEKYWGFEPDPGNVLRLHATVDATSLGRDGRTEILPYAVGNKNCRLRFDATGDVGARVCADGAIEVESRRLDDVLGDAVPTFIKMDIEGAELDAISGAQLLVQRCRPTCAVCVYHLQHHLWAICLALHRSVAGYSIYFRTHRCGPKRDICDVVCYAVPQESSN